MKVGAKAEGISSPSSNIQEKKSSEKTASKTVTPSKNDKVEISDEAKAKAEKLAQENLQLKDKLKNSRDKLSKSQKIEALRSDKAALIRKPGVFFIGGLSLGGLTSSDGIEAMGEHIPDADHFSWSDKDKILKEISRRPLGEPIVLVGDGLGAGTAVEIANKLNSLEYGYRPINLLVTIDGSGSEFIPQNVKENLNVLDGEGGFFKSGPTIARNTELTKVENQLIENSKNSLDENEEVQFKIFNKINRVLAETGRASSKDTLEAKIQKAKAIEVSSDKLDKLVAKDLGLL